MNHLTHLKAHPTEYEMLEAPGSAGSAMNLDELSRFSQEIFSLWDFGDFRIDRQEDGIWSPITWAECADDFGRQLTGRTYRILVNPGPCVCTVSGYHVLDLFIVLNGRIKKMPHEDL